MQKTPILILVMIIVIVGLIWFFSADTVDTTTEESTTELSSLPEDSDSNNVDQLSNDAVLTSEADATADTTVTPVVPTPTPTENMSGTYTTYSTENVATAEGDVVLFFKASWCPSCRALDADIVANQGDIPDGVTILSVDYDTHTALKQKYGVTTQHTLVQVDTDGNLIKKWSGTPRLSSLLAEL